MGSLKDSQFRKPEVRGSSPRWGSAFPSESGGLSIQSRSVQGENGPNLVPENDGAELLRKAVLALPFRVRDLSGFSPAYLASLKLRLESKVAIDPSTGCWLWTASLDEHGYGFLHVGSKRDRTARMARAHRVAFELFRGPVPEGLVLDHLCRVRHCANPAHLEPVPFATNILRGAAPNIVSHNTGKCTRCDSDLSLNRRGDGYCRPCSLKYHRAYDAKRPRTIARAARAAAEVLS